MGIAVGPEMCQTVLDNLEVGIHILDRDRRILWWNAGAEKIAGYLRHEVIGKFCFDNLLLGCEEGVETLCRSRCPLEAALRDGAPRACDVFLLHKDGLRVPVRLHAVPIRNASGAIVAAAASFNEREPHPAEASFRAPQPETPDTFIGILEGPVFEERLKTAVRDLESRGMPFGLLHVGIERFEQFRKRCGPVAARNASRVLAQTLAHNVGRFDAVSRSGPSTFLVLISQCPAPSLGDAARELHAIAGSASIPWWGDHLAITVAVGGAAARPGESAESLLERSASALAASFQSAETVVVL